MCRAVSAAAALPGRITSHPTDDDADVIGLISIGLSILASLARPLQPL